MPSPTSSIKRLLIVPAVAVLTLLGGCGGVSLEGPGFDALGISEGKDKGDKKVPDRAPLLIPPDRSSLPAPQQSVASAPPQNWPNDPGDVLKAKAGEDARKQKDYEDYGDWTKKADIDEFEKLMDPLERKQGLFSKDKKLDDENRDFREFKN